MEYFRKLLSAIGVNTVQSQKVDIISNLPTEISQYLLRMLDARTLLNVAIVSRRWHSVCKGDCYIRRSIRHHLRKQKRNLLQVAKKAKTSNHAHQPDITRISHFQQIKPSFGNIRFVHNFESSRSTQLMTLSSRTNISVRHTGSVSRRIVMVR